MSDRICQVDGCTQKHYGRGFCKLHWKRWNVHGTTERRTTRKPPTRRDPLVRFWKRVAKSDECWLWTGGLHSKGYGLFYCRPDGTTMRAVGAHRFSYELHHGPIPAGMLVCHSCDNPPCVNPAHLFLGSPKANIHDMMSKGRGWWQRAS